VVLRLAALVEAGVDAGGAVLAAAGVGGEDPAVFEDGDRADAGAGDAVGSGGGGRGVGGIRGGIAGAAGGEGGGKGRGRGKGRRWD